MSDGYPYHDYDDEEDNEGDLWEDECGLMKDGQCSLAGTEHCDFCCPMRDSEFFCGSKAWKEKHSRKKRQGSGA